MLTRRPLAIPFLALAIVSWVLSAPLFAERIGTPYRGPLELVSSGGQDNAGEPSTGGDTGGGDSGGGDSGGPPAPGAGGGATAGGPGGKTAKLDGTVVWQWWWEYSKETYLARASERGRVNMGSSYYWFGGGAKFPPRDIVPPSEKQRAAASFTQLAKSLHDDTSAAVRAEAAIALGRLGVVAAGADARKENEPDNLVVRDLIRAADKDTIPEVRTSAILALGMTRDRDAVKYLLRLHE
jgi:hypothetical protein